MKKFLKFLGVLVGLGAVGLGVLLFLATREKPTTGEAIEKFVNEDIKGSGSYWLEMENSFAQWEKMILVFGYVDDRTPCNSIQKIAAADAPNRQFRCVRAD